MASLRSTTSPAFADGVSDVGLDTPPRAVVHEFLQDPSIFLINLLLAIFGYGLDGFSSDPNSLNPVVPDFSRYPVTADSRYTRSRSVIYRRRRHSWSGFETRADYLGSEIGEEETIWRIIPCPLAGSSNDSQIGEEETGSVLIGLRFGGGSSEITPMNDHYRVDLVDIEAQTGNDPAPVENSGNSSHWVTQLRQLVRPYALPVLLVTSEISCIIFEVMYQESHLGAYLYLWAVPAITSMFVARLQAENEDGIARREQFTVFFRCFSFLVPAVLEWWGIHNGNHVTALKIILKITGAFVGWWVADKFQKYMNAFRLPVSRAN